MNLRLSRNQSAPLILILTLAIQQANGFIFSRFNVNPKLQEIAQAQSGLNLNIGLQVINPITYSQLYIDNLAFELQCKSPQPLSSPSSSTPSPIISLPGANGDQPELSTGPLHLQTKSYGKYITVEGQKSLKESLTSEAWEIVWVDDRPTGSLVCGFHLSESAIRNDAVLPKGEIYLNFRVWTRKGLHTAQNEKMMYERQLVQHIEEEQEALRNMKETSNPIMKAVHFRNAAAANEKIMICKTSRFDTVPMEDKDVILIGGIGSNNDSNDDHPHPSEELVIAKQGSIWTQVREKNMLGGYKDTNYYIGGAILKDDINGKENTEKTN